MMTAAIIVLSVGLVYFMAWFLTIPLRPLERTDYTGRLKQYLAEGLIHQAGTFTPEDGQRCVICGFILTPASQHLRGFPEGASILVSPSGYCRIDCSGWEDEATGRGCTMKDGES